jgi:hypothetical protein
MMIQIPWMQVYLAYITKKEIPKDPVKARQVIRRSKAFTMFKGKLYKQSISGVLQRCATPEEWRVISKNMQPPREQPSNRSQSFSGKILLAFSNRGHEGNRAHM